MPPAGTIASKASPASLSSEYCRARRRASALTAAASSAGLPTRSPMVACRRGCAPARATHRRRPLIAWGSDPAAGGVQGGVEDQDVHGRTGEHQQGAGVGSEGHRHQQLRRPPAQPDGEDHNHRQQRGDCTVDTDKRRQQGGDPHHQQDQADPAPARETDQQTPKPRRNACRVDGLSHHEECGDQHHRSAAEARERLLQTDDTGAKQGQGHTERDDLDRQPVPHKRRHRDDKDQNGDGNVRHEGHAKPKGLPRDTPARETAARDRRPLASRRATRSMATSDPARSLAGARRTSHGE